MMPLSSWSSTFSRPIGSTSSTTDGASSSTR
jgi:hypothetical protein